MDASSLALSAIHPAFGIAKAIRTFYKDYHHVPEELERLAKQADTWEEIINTAHVALQGVHQPSSDNSPGTSDVVLKQFDLCKKLLYQLSDELKMPAEAAKRHSWSRVKKAFERKGLEESMAKLKDCCDQFHIIASIGSMDQFGKKMEGIKLSLDNLRSEGDERQARATKQAVLQWITSECQSKTHNDHAGDFEEGTLDAILNSDRYYAWQNGLLNDDGSAVAPATLWCHGPPGAGKSTLVYAIIERLRKFYDKDAVIVYAYCSYEKQDVQSARNIIACMVRTAVSQYERLPDFVLEAWERHDRLNPLSLLSLRELLCRLLTSRRKSFILVDALDEITCSHSKNEKRLEPDEVLDEVMSMVDNVNKLKADQGQVCCRALLTSREKCPERFPRVEVAEMSIEAAETDVQLTVEALIDRKFFRRLDKQIRDDAGVRADIVDRISKGAKGVFLLAKLQLEHLREFTNVRSLTEALEDLPQDLQDSHERSMQRIQNQPAEPRETALKALSLVYRAKGLLTVKSAQQALAVRDGDEEFKEKGIEDEETLVNITAGLLATRSGNLAFVHHTVKEFLRKPEEKGNVDFHGTTPGEATQDWFTDKDLAHGYVAKQCLNFLVLKDFAEPLDPEQRKLRAQRFPFLDYAINNVGYHAYRSTILENQRYEVTRRCLALLDNDAMPLGSLQEFLARLWTNPIPTRVRALQLPKPHFAVLCNFLEIAKDLVTVENVNDTATRKVETVLHFAAQIKSQEMVEILLKKGADRDLVNYSGKTPLDMILAEPLLRLTLTRENPGTMLSGNPESFDNDLAQAMFNFTFLHYVESRTGGEFKLHNGEHSISMTSLENAVARRGATNEIETIIEEDLKLTISEEGEKLASFLINAGVDINSHQTSRETPLQLATLYELPGLVKLLLEKGANPFLAWHCTFTAAEIAEKRGNPELTKILREKEKEIDAWESSVTDEADKQNVPGRVQAAHFMRESRRHDPERLERMNGPLYSMFDTAFTKVAEAEEKEAKEKEAKEKEAKEKEVEEKEAKEKEAKEKEDKEAKEKHASPHLSKPSNESTPAESVQPPQQQSYSEAAKASESPSTETESLLVSKPPEDSSSYIATGGCEGDDDINGIKDKREATDVLANTPESNAKGLEAAAAAAAGAAGSSIEFDSEEDTFIEHEGSGTPSKPAGAITEPRDDSHDNWDDADVTLHVSEDELLPLTAVD